jgi:hypothetical protein
VQGCLAPVSAHSTRLHWRWQPARGNAARGTFSDDEPAGAYAIERLVHLQGSFVEDPKALPLPRALHAPVAPERGAGQAGPKKLRRRPAARTPALRRR